MAHSSAAKRGPETGVREEADSSYLWEAGCNLQGPGFCSSDCKSEADRKGGDGQKVVPSHAWA